MRPDRRGEILAAASRLIAERGYPDVSLEAVCEAAACSKSAIYDCFGNKHGLLLALVDNAAGTIAQAQYVLHLPNLEAPAALRRYAGLLLERALATEQLAVLRAAVGVGARHPEAARRFRDVALATTDSALAQFLGAKAASGELVINEPMIAAQQFHALVFTGELLGAVVDPGGSERRAGDGNRIEEAVDLFIACYGPV